MSHGEAHPKVVARRASRRWLRTVPVCWLLFLGVGSGIARAHEVRPAFLQLTEVAEGRFDVLWKQPLLAADAVSGQRLPLEPVLPANCRSLGQRIPEIAGGALIERWAIDCGPEGDLASATNESSSALDGQTLGVSGLSRTLTDILVRIELADGSEINRLLRPASPSFVIGADEKRGAETAAYLRLGIEHLLFGFDHILFVIGLLFFVRRPLQLFGVVTSFTVAHSITLALSALGVVRLSQAPVEAVIALSILFLAVELSKDPDLRSPVASRPWAIAFGFGLLHGFGFAGALADIGLPRNAAAPALFLFNVGVEVGQLLVVTVVLLGLAALRASRVQIPRMVARAPIWAMGIISAYWFVERVARLV